jgi:hypothetical protein
MNYRETVDAQIRFEFQERERRLAKLMGREPSTRSIAPGRDRIGKLVARFGNAPDSEVGSLSKGPQTERERPLTPVQDLEAAS